MSLKLHTPKKYVYIVLLMKEWKKNKKKTAFLSNRFVAKR